MLLARGGLVCAVLLASGCSMAPAYHVPQVPAPSAFREGANWVEARPADAGAAGTWWTAFGDPVLDDLEARLDTASPTLAAALARYQQAAAIARIDAADLLPTVSASGGASRERLSAGRPLATRSATYDSVSVGASLTYELDLWGRVRNSVKASRADADASRADLAAARLSLQAQLADSYLELRGLDAQAELLRQTAAAYERAHQLTTTRHDGGIASGLDVSRAQSVLSSARAQLSDVANARALVEHRIAALVGESASGFVLTPSAPPVAPPLPTEGTPSELLQRRPDVAAAERRMAAANARIGVAKAAFFPSVTLGLDGGYETTHGALLSAPNSSWALGPLAAALTLFDAGRRTASVRNARAQFDEAAADYRGAVLGAFRDVEDGLASARNLAQQARDQRSAAAAARRTEDLALSRYHDGASDYLDVVTAQTAALSAQREALLVETDRLRANVALVRALGGGVPTGGGKE